ncbi:MAG: thermonuclease family protein [Nitrospirales bacterium]
MENFCRRTLTLALLMGALLFTGPALADWMGTVERVKDGDTLVLQRGEERITVRLTGIDAPETAQRFGVDAAEFVRALVDGQTVTVRGTEQDQYHRLLATIELPDGRDLNRELVRHGLAWWFFKYSSDRVLAELELEARLARIGLWSQASPIPPWIFRHLKDLFH